MRIPLSRMIVSISMGLLITAASAAAEPARMMESVSVTPNQGAPGHQVRVQLTCHDGRGGNVVALALHLTSGLAPDPHGHQPLSLFATAVVNDVEPGRYEVRATCGARREVSTSFIVQPKAAPFAVPHQVTPMRIPKGAAETGGGGTATS